MKDQILVALETSGPVGSVAVSAGGVVLGRDFLGERGGHASGLVPALNRILTASGISRSTLTGVVVGSGPGSFTGVRVAAAAGKGVAHALSIPLFGVSSLLGAVLTEEAIPGDDGPWPALSTESSSWSGRDRYVLFDARGDRLFAAAYRLGGSVPVELRPPRFLHLGDLLEDEELARAAHCGDGALTHMDALQASGRRVLPPPVGFPSADGLLRYMKLVPDLPALEDPFRWEPEYLRASNAERGRDG